MKMLTLLAALGLALTGSTAQAGPFFANKDGGMLWDQATGLVWMRCSLGQHWSGTTCAGDVRTYTFSQAQDAPREANAEAYGGLRNWRLPSVRELATLIVCSNGIGRDGPDIGDGESAPPKICGFGSLDPTIDQIAMPNTDSGPYWTRSPNASRAETAWNANFNLGTFDGFGHKGSYYGVRLVHSYGVDAAEIRSAFPKKLSQIDDRYWAALPGKRTAEKEDAVRKAAARDSAERQANLRRQLAPGAQGLYLQAAQKQRSGDTSEAARLYELIIEHFPRDPLAVKAADQLTALNRIEQAQSNSRSNARQTCEAQKATCLASCPQDRTSKVASPDFFCAARCNSVSCY